MMRGRLAAALTVIALIGCGSHAQSTTRRGTSSQPPTAKRTANQSRGCNDSSALRAFATEPRLAPQERAAVLRVAVLVERHPVRGDVSCATLQVSLKAKGPAPQPVGTPDDLCLQALNSLMLVAHLPAQSSSRHTKQAARHAYRVVLRYEQRGQTVCVVPAASSH
jgi:hypothetical protein